MTNRERYQHLLTTHDITQIASADLVAAITARPCSPRTVRAWLNDPSKPSSRPCPDWALKALEKAIALMQKYVAERQAAAQGN